MEVSKLSVIKQSVQNPQKKEPVKTKQEPTGNNAKAITFSLLGLAALGAAAVALTRKGKAEEVLTLAVDAFKQGGNKFKKGKALLADGSGYTGILTKINKKGDKIAMEYKDGALVKSVKNAGNDILHGNFVKNYKYDANGKLQFVEKQQVVPGATLKTTADLAQKKADGLAKYEKAKQLELEKKLAPTKSELARTEKNIDADYIERSFNDYERLAETNKDYRQLIDQYEKIEQKDQQIKEGVSKLKEHMHKKPEITAQKIDNQFKTDPGLTKMNEYYQGLEQKKAYVEKLKNKMAQKPEIKASPELLDSSTQKASQSDLKELTKMNNRLRKIEEKTALTTEAKTTTTEESGKTVTKNYLKNKKGKNILMNRETVMPDGSVKTVVHNTDGISEVTIKNANGEILSVKKYDKKGNVLFEAAGKSGKPGKPKGPDADTAPKVFAQWYNDYLRLCRKNGIEPSTTSKDAWMQFRELVKREAAEISVLKEKALLEKFLAAIKEVVFGKELDKKISRYYPEEREKIKSFVSQYFKGTSKVTDTKEQLLARINGLNIDVIENHLGRLNNVLERSAQLNGTGFNPMEVNSKNFVEHMISIRKNGTSLEDTIGRLETALSKKIEALAQQRYKQYGSGSQYVYA